MIGEDWGDLPSDFEFEKNNKNTLFMRGDDRGEEDSDNDEKLKRLAVKKKLKKSSKKLGKKDDVVEEKPHSKRVKKTRASEFADAEDYAHLIESDDEPVKKKSRKHTRNE